MPLYKVDIEKFAQSYYWTNTYTVQADTIQAAHANGLQIMEWERQIHQIGVTFTKVRASDREPNTDVFITSLPNSAGLWNVSGNQMLPMFVTVRMDFSVGVGRPSRKFFRMCAGENDQDWGTLSDARRTAIATAYGQPLLNSGFYVDVDGQAFVSATVARMLSGRQMRRGSKRKAREVIPA